MNIFDTTEATKKIDDFPVLSNISLSIKQGERIAITGQNGSGKSSLLKLIGGIYEATSGKVVRIQLKVAYVPEHFPETIRFNLYEYLMLMGKMSGRSSEEINETIKLYAQHFAIVNFLKIPLKKCSKGTKQKAGIIQALLAGPQLLLMDEPLTGLDGASQKELIMQLHQLPSDTTIIFTAHDSYLIDELAQRVLRIDGGRIIFDTYKQKKERLMMIKARIFSKDVLAEITCVQQVLTSESIVEIIVAESESDHALRKLLERGSSILEVIEKR